jgi:hypothetical protein
MLMGLLNHNCIRIKYKAINLLYCYFIDLELREKQIQTLILANKENFEKYFSKFTEDISDTDIIEKKQCILYELERLLNMN